MHISSFRTPIINVIYCPIMYTYIQKLIIDCPNVITPIINNTYINYRGVDIDNHRLFVVRNRLLSMVSVGKSISIDCYCWSINIPSIIHRKYRYTIDCQCPGIDIPSNLRVRVSIYHQISGSGYRYTIKSYVRVSIYHQISWKCIDSDIDCPKHRSSSSINK